MNELENIVYNKHCERCGGTVDPFSNKCLNCGRKNKNYKVPFIISIFLILVLAVTSVSFGYKNEIDKKTITELKNLYDKNSAKLAAQTDQSEKLNNLEEENKKLQDDVNKLKDENYSLMSENETMKKYEEKAKFLDNNIALIVNSLNNVYYHRYDCAYFKDCDGFYAYNIQTAKATGYEPCKLCHKD